MINIAGYYRVSTSMQVQKHDEEYEGSLRDQKDRITREAIKRYSDKEYIITEYIEEGKSGKDTKNRPEFQRMIQDVKAGKINVIICAELSRAFRSLSDAISYVELFKKSNVRFLTLDFDIDTDSIYGDLIFKIMSAIYEMERKITAERLKHSRREKTERGLFTGGNIPFGYEGKTEVVLSRGIERKKITEIIPHKEESETVKWMYQEYLESGSFGMIKTSLNNKGIKTKTGNKWTTSSIARILENPVYIGEIKVKDKFLKAAFPAIIDKGLFQKVQKLIELHRTHRNNTIKPRGENYILSGVIKCHKCGTGMTGHLSNGKRYYRCRKCNFDVQADKLEGVLIGVMNESLDRKDLFKSAIDEAKEKDTHYRNELRQQKAKHEKGMKKQEKEKTGLLVALVKANNPETVTAINERIKELSTSGGKFDIALLQAIDSEIQDVDYEGHVFETMKKVKEFKGIESLEIPHKKELIRETIQKAIVNRDQLILTLNSGGNIIKAHTHPRVPVV